MTVAPSDTPILVLGATGTVGRPLVFRLVELGYPVRAVSRDPQAAEGQLPASVQVVVGGLGRNNDLSRALEGVRTILLHGPLTADLDELHASAIDAAVAAGVHHVVRISALGASTESSNQISQMHGNAEAALESSGLSWTHIRPHTFMDNYLGYAGDIKAGDLYSASDDGRVPPADAVDVAAVAAVALTKPGHAGKILRVSGPVALTYREIAAAFSRSVGHRVVHRNVTTDELIEREVSVCGRPRWIAESLADLQRYWADGRSAKVYPTVRDLVGRPGLTLEQFLQRNRAAFLRPSDRSEGLRQQVSLDRIEAAERDSFPASDPPAWTSATATRGRK
jgi:uncharacterized protein YbjT (DUF2867 family)